MNYYIADYDFEKHELLIEEGDSTQPEGTWADLPQLSFYESNVVKVAYSLSLVNGDAMILTFFNDLYLNAKDGHKLSVEEIAIFMLLLIRETRNEAQLYLESHYYKNNIADMSDLSPDAILAFVENELNVEN
jgi:hypothetical protein